MRNSPYLNLAEIRRLPVGVPRERFRLRKLLFVSNLLPTKGLETLLDAMTILDYSLTIVGDGDPAYVSRLKRYVIRKRLSDKVSFAGWIKRQELLKTYHNFSALIVPSLVPEANPGVAYEAIATGTPLVAIARGAFSYPPFSDHGLCILSSSDSKDLAGKLKCLMENYETYHEYWRRSIDYRPQIAREKASFPFLLEAAVKAIQTKGQTDRETLATMQKKLRLQFQE
jgi:glycosyltransferase involved in cell wall biosynthesis